MSEKDTRSRQNKKDHGEQASRTKQEKDERSEEEEDQWSDDDCRDESITSSNKNCGSWRKKMRSQG